MLFDEKLTCGRLLDWNSKRTVIGIQSELMFVLIIQGMSFDLFDTIRPAAT
jgi:hypothetical protein